jgi:uncharacterized protein (TIGR03066 family)
MRTAIAAVAFLVLAGFTTAADDKIDAKKLIGKWEPAKPTKDEPPFILEFTDKNKVIVSVTMGGKTSKIEGTYKVDGNKVEVTMNFNGKELKDTHTVSKLTDTELVSKDSKGKEETMKRVKSK